MGPAYKRYDPKKIAITIARIWNPSKTVFQQEEIIYKAAFDTSPWYRKNALESAIPGLMLNNLNTNDNTSPVSQNSPLGNPSTLENEIKYAKKEITISVDNNRIKTTVGGVSSYAVPAECNLDIILAVPVNSTAAVTEIKEELKGFIEKFYYTRGVYMGLIPYSGKLSIPSERYDDWTESIMPFSGLKSDGYGFKKLSLYQLYGTKGIMGTALTEKYDDSKTANEYYPIMSQNYYFNSAIWDSSNDSDYHDELHYKYRRMNLNPCIQTEYPSPTKCTSNCTSYKANPNPITELSGDLNFVLSRCDRLFVPQDFYNSSNFVFAALEWSYNLLKKWTNDPQILSVDGNNKGVLKNPSKTIAERKKNIIMIVNKPDEFIDNEMTYIGFSNDADEIYEDLDWKETALPALSDSCWWRGVCYGNGKFVGVSGNYTTESTIGAYSTDGINWKESIMPSGKWIAVCYGNGKYVAVGSDYPPKRAYSTDGIHWSLASSVPGIGVYSVSYGKGKFLSVQYKSEVVYSTDGINWTKEPGILPQQASWRQVCYGNDKFIACDLIGNVGAYSTDGVTWHPITLPLSGEWKLCYGNGKYVAVNDDIHADLDKGAMYSTDGIVWFPANMPASAYRESVCYGNGKFVFVSFDGGYSSDGINWFPSNLGGRYATVCYGNNKFVALGFNFNKAIYCDGEVYIKKNVVGNRFCYYCPITSLTTKACTKLKQVYGDNIKIHIIKYRKDSGNYSYLDDCAVSTGGKVYDISNQADLKVKLDEIATELKTWAGRTEAKNVD